MELRHLKYFVAVAEELHFGRAARRLHVSQPPLSQQIRVLEAELGAMLFLRTKRRVELTDAGRVFLAEARLVLEAAHRAARAVGEAVRGERGLLTVGFVTSATLSILPRVVREFRAAHPAVAIELREMIPAAQLAALERREIDVGFLRPPVEDPAVDSEVVSSESLVAAVPSDHPLAARRTVALADLAEEPFVLFPRRHGPGVTDVVLAACREAGFTPRTLCEPNEMQTILAHVAAGSGVSVVPGSLATLSRELVAFRPLRDAPSSIDLVLAWTRLRTSVLVDDLRRVARAVGRRCRGELRRSRPPR